MAIVPLIYSIDATGIHVPTEAELVAWYQANFLAIYGVDVSVQDSSSPDNQEMMIWVQANLDIADLQIQGFNSFDPDNAIGTVLDQRVAINGIQRQAGTFSTTDVTIVNTQSINLYGIDQDIQPPYIVSDNANNQWQLMTSQVALAAGTHVLQFQAANPGAVLATANTITTQVTIVLGISSINNPTPQNSIGINEESDGALKIRRQQSVSLSSQGYYAGLKAALLNIVGVSFVNIVENDTDGTVGGVPSHSIWVIVAGGSATDIADAIYEKRNAGCGMFGSESVLVVRPNGNSLIVNFDYVTEKNIFTQFIATSIDGIHPPNIAAIRSGLATSFVPDVDQTVNISALAAAVQAIDSNTLVTSAGFSTGAVQTLTLSATAASGAFKLSYLGVLTVSIAWNAVAGTIQTNLNAILPAGVTVVVTGSISSHTLTFTFSGTVTDIIKVTNNSLLTGGAVAITSVVSLTLTNLLTPATANIQFSVISEDIIITAIILAAPGVAYVISSGVVTSTTVTIAASSTLQFAPLGGFGDYSYARSGSSSGASISGAGLYTAGAAGTDTITVTDSIGLQAICTVTVS